MKRIAATVLLTGCFLGAACSPEEEAPKGPVTPTATMAPVVDEAQAAQRRALRTRRTDVATAIVPAEATPTPTAAP
jgi:hypothetical protein